MRRALLATMGLLVATLAVPAHDVYGGPGPQWIDTNDRAAVLSSYNANLSATLPPPNWNGDVATCQPGTLAPAYRAAYMDRVNWFRRMAGVVPVVEDPGYTTMAQAAALIGEANRVLSHNPPPTAACWTQAGRDGASRSNLAGGISGENVIQGFMDEHGPVGHRSWLMASQTSRMGVGSVPLSYLSEALLVVDSAPPSPLPTREPNRFVPWPPRGLVPAPVVYGAWSLFSGQFSADLSATSVDVQVNGQSVPVLIEHKGPGFAAQTLTFVPTLPPLPADDDLDVTVTVSGIQGAGMPPTHTWTTTIVPAPTAHAPADFDGDGTAEEAVFRPSDGHWYVRGGAIFPWGATGDIPVPADYDGDSKTDAAVFRPGDGLWYVHGSESGDRAVPYGIATDVPVPGDYDGDGLADVAVFRPSTGLWFGRLSGGGDQVVAYGTSGDVPVPGDYDGDGQTDLAVFRPSTGLWFARLSGSGSTQVIAFGTPGDVPVPADYDGDRRTDVAVFRSSGGLWFERLSGGGSAIQSFGTGGDVPAPGDYDGDGRADVTVFRPSAGLWFERLSGGGDEVLAYGTGGDVTPVLPPAVRLQFFP